MAAATNKERVHTYLLVKGGGQAERIIVWDSQDVSVGRSPENDISIDDAALSRRHAEFYRADGAWAIKDLGTSNGTTVNGETIRTRVLQNKDVVRFGEIEISFVQVAKNPAAIGKRVEFASQLKSFGGAAGQAKDGEATMLGLVQTLDEDDDEEDFVVGKMNDFGADLADMQAPAKRQAPRDLDAELGALGGDELGGDRCSRRLGRPRRFPARRAPPAGGRQAGPASRAAPRSGVGARRRARGAAGRASRRRGRAASRGGARPGAVRPRRPRGEPSRSSSRSRASPASCAAWSRRCWAR